VTRATRVGTLCGMFPVVDIVALSLALSSRLDSGARG
jgi:hypothetical protein